MPTKQFTIPGEPIGKPRMTRADKWKKRPCVLAYRAWADVARLSAGALPAAEAIDEIECVAYFRPPPSWSQKKQAAVIGKPHCVKPDADNVLKSVCDALFKQDSALADLIVRKRYGWESRIDVTIDYRSN